MFIETLRLDGLLSFSPGSPEIGLKPLNVVIGPNGSGKSNLIEAFELLRATPTAFAGAIRDGGGAREWICKGSAPQPAEIDASEGRAGRTRVALSTQVRGRRYESRDRR